MKGTKNELQLNNEQRKHIKHLIIRYVHTMKVLQLQKTIEQHIII